jgi:hypothetical protein
MLNDQVRKCDMQSYRSRAVDRCMWLPCFNPSARSARIAPTGNRKHCTSFPLAIELERWITFAMLLYTLQ